MEVFRRSFLSVARCSVSVRARSAGRRCLSTAASPTSETVKKPNSDAGSGGKEVAGDGYRRVLSGLQPTGALHLGNYFGALRRCVRAQDSGDDLMLFIADLHALTTTHDANKLQEHSLELAALALAAGIDPTRTVLFAQSAVPRHAELCWLLACLTTQARVHHLPQYREKVAAAADPAAIPLGLLLYPVLQAADILLYRATHVPTGADQQNHLQLAALLARTFRHRYGDAFPVPRAWLPDDGSDRVLSLRDPTRKMSKSDLDRRAAVLLTDSDDAIREKVRKAVTDFEPRVTYDPETRPGVSNLVALHCLAQGKLPEEVVEECDGLTTAQYKGVVAEALIQVVRPIRERASEFRAKPQLLRDILAIGAARARRRADDTYEQVEKLVGLAPSILDGPRQHTIYLQPLSPVTDNKPLESGKTKKTDFKTKKEDSKTKKEDSKTKKEDSKTKKEDSKTKKEDSLNKGDSDKRRATSS